MCRPSVHSTASYHFSSHNPPESIVAYLLVQSTNNTKSTKQIRRSITQQQTDKVSQSQTSLLVLLIPCRGREEAMYPHPPNSKGTSHDVVWPVTSCHRNATHRMSTQNWKSQSANAHQPNALMLLRTIYLSLSCLEAIVTSGNHGPDR
jgi:hypothetical protein